MADRDEYRNLDRDPTDEIDDALEEEAFRTGIPIHIMSLERQLSFRDTMMRTGKMTLEEAREAFRSGYNSPLLF
jgi:hypothetical protein